MHALERVFDGHLGAASLHVVADTHRGECCEAHQKAHHDGEHDALFAGATRLGLSLRLEPRRDRWPFRGRCDRPIRKLTRDLLHRQPPADRRLCRRNRDGTRRRYRSTRRECRRLPVGCGRHGHMLFKRRRDRHSWSGFAVSPLAIIRPNMRSAFDRHLSTVHSRSALASAPIYSSLCICASFTTHPSHRRVTSSVVK